MESWSGERSTGRQIFLLLLVLHLVQVSHVQRRDHLLYLGEFCASPASCAAWPWGTFP